jgi:RimJ/RimL family protein N-acetyltransferase
MAPESNPALDPQPVTLTGKLVRLEPLGPEHVDDLYAAGADDSIWRYLPRPAFVSLDDARQWIEQSMAQTSRGERVAFAVVHLETGQAIGSTAYLDIDRPNRALEIGMTWYGTAWQRTGVNTECKYLLMRNAFEDQSARRVCLKTDSRNERSRRAILRLGAVEEGTWRNHRIAWDGMDRHSVFYSVIDTEWPDVKQRLESLMRR